MIIEKSKDFFDAYSDNCDGIYAAGESVIVMVSMLLVKVLMQ